MTPKWPCLVLALFLVFGAAGCAVTTQPFEYHDDRNEKAGPGLLSGEEGGFILYETPKAKKDQHDTASQKE